MELQKELNRVVEWIVSEVESRHKSGIVIGLSGGVDSSVSAALAVRGLGHKRVFGLVMPCLSQLIDRDDADMLAKQLGIETHEADLGLVYETMQVVSPVDLDGNTRSRLRMSMLYGVAAKMNYLVLGTTNYSELMTGYFTKWGDGSVDLEPLLKFYKWEVFEMGRLLGLSERILSRVPTAGYTSDQTDEGELGLTYPKLDGVLKFMREFPQGGDIPPIEQVMRVLELIAGSAHKRDPIPFFHRI